MLERLTSVAKTPPAAWVVRLKADTADGRYWTFMVPLTANNQERVLEFGALRHL